MSNRWLRFVIALVALAAASGALYRIFQQEQQLARDAEVSASADLAGETAIATVAELKAALHAYVAPGQGQAFWTARAAMLLDKLRSSLLELDKVASTAGAPLTESLDLTDRLAALEKRARDHVRDGQALLAGELVFTDARDPLDAIRIQAARARDEVARSAAERQAIARREEMVFGLGGAGILALAVLVLVPPGRATPRPPVVEDTIPAIPPDPRPPSRRKPPEVTPREVAAANPGAADAPVDRAASASPRLDSPGALRRDHADLGPAEASAKAEAAFGREEGAAFTAAASLCTDIARVSDGDEISALLGRAATVLNATGIIVWMASEDRATLFPAAATGYDERVIARVRAIARDDANLTAAAFRDGASRTSAAAGATRAALAVPLVRAQGPVGVFSAEIGGQSEVDPQRLAIATIVAAQLSTILGSITPAEEQAPAHGAQR